MFHLSVDACSQLVFMRLNPCGQLDILFPRFQGCSFQGNLNIFCPRGSKGIGVGPPATCELANVVPC